MKRSLMLLAIASIVLVGCGKSDTPSASTSSAPVPTGEVKGEITVAAFKGGFGVDFYEKAAKEFEAKHPGVTVKVEGDSQIWDKLRPRFVAGNPPDLTFPGWGMDHWALKDEDQLLSLDDALKTKAAEGDGTWGDSFEPALLKLGQQDGKTWILPYFFSVLGWWYDPDVFAKHGWTPPTTYDELLALAPKIKAAGMAPITFQGKYPDYMLGGLLLPWVYSIGGKPAMDACQNLEPGAWKSPAMLQAAKMIDELNKKGFLQSGAVAMTHTEAQQQFVQGKAAMIPCGTWLKAEMKDSMPAGAKMEFMMPPVVGGGKGEPTSLIIKIEPWMVPSKGKNPQGAIELFKYMTSLSMAKRFVEEKGTLMAIKGSDQAKMMPELTKPAASFKASKDVWAIQYMQWYPAFEKEVEGALTSLINGELTPEAFCDRVEKKAEEIRNDSSVTKHKV